jgi:transposase
MEQAGVLERLKNRDITQRQAGFMLKLSIRTIRRKLKKYRTLGAASLHHGNVGRSSSRKLSETDTSLAIELLKGVLHDSGPTYLADKMHELYGIKVCHETLRKLMIRNGLWQVSKHSPKHRSRRPRRVSLGMMVQLDGSRHDWFEGRAPECTLLVFIDDATSKILWLEFVSGESTEGAMTATQNYFKKHGRPLSFYVDYGGVWSVNTNNPERDKLTQFERAMKELDIKMIHASSPQAKGRVERSNKTLQDRLIKDMRLSNICSMAQANKFVQEVYIPQHNAKFAVKPAESIDMHRSIDGINLYDIMCYQETRMVQNDFTVVYYKQFFQLASHQPAVVRPKNEVEISLHLDGKISISIRDLKLNFTTISQRPEKQILPVIPKPEAYSKPAKNHVWKTGIPVRYKLKHAPAMDAVHKEGA